MIESKACGRCGNPVPIWSQVGQQCPHCGVVWGGQRNVNSADAPSRPSAEPRTRQPRTESEAVVSPEGKWKARAEEGGFIRVEEVGGSKQHRFVHRGPLVPACFGPGDRTIVTVGQEGRVRVFNLADGRAASPVLTVHAWGAMFTPTGEVMVANRGAIAFRNATTGALVRDGTIRSCARRQIVAVWLNQDGTRVKTLETNGHQIEWDVRTGRPVGFPRTGPAISLAAGERALGTY